MRENLEKTYSRDGVGMCRQRFQTLPRLHVPYPDALIELDVKETNTSHSHSRGRPLDVLHLFTIPLRTHRAGHDKVGLGVEVAAEHVVAVTF